MDIIPDLWLMFLHAIPFFLTLIMLQVVLFKPLLAYLDDRVTAIEGSRSDAVSLQEKAEQKLSEYENRLAEARSKLATSRAETRKNAMDERDQKLAVARKQAEAKIAEAVAAIRLEQKAASAELNKLTEDLAQHISTQVLPSAALQDAP